MPGSPTGASEKPRRPTPASGFLASTLATPMKRHRQQKRKQPLSHFSVDEEVELMFAAAEAHPSWEVLPDRGGIRRTGTDGPDTPEKLLAWFLAQPRH